MLSSRVVCPTCHSISPIPLHPGVAPPEYLCRNCNIEFVSNAVQDSSNKREYRITKRVDGMSSQVTVMGAPLPMPEYPDLQLFYRELDGLLIVSEVVTGLKIGTVYASVEEASKEILAILRKTNITNLKKTIFENKMPEKPA